MDTSPVTCTHADRKPYAHGLCQLCYNMWYYHTHPEHRLRRFQRQKLNNRRYYATNTCGRGKESSRRAGIAFRLRRHGLTPQRFEQMVKDQNNQCAICLKPLSSNMTIDHSHTTEKVRGILCMNCNCGLGQFKDDADTITRAAAYLRFHAQQHLSAAT